MRRVSALTQMKTSPSPLRSAWAAPRRSASLVALVLLLASILSPRVALADDEPEVQSPGQALRADLETIAETNGWTLQEAETDHHASETIRSIAGRIAREEPEHYVGAAVGPDPDSRPRLYLKGSASAFARGLVEDADIDIRIVDEQPYSFYELGERVTRVQEALLEHGVQDASIAVDVMGAGRIPVRIRATDASPSKAEIRAMIPADLRDDADITMDTEGSWEPDHAGGGMKTQTSPVQFFCTSGWSVTGPSYNGIVQAEHCKDAIDTIHGAHSMTLQDEHYGAYGDVEIFSTATTDEPYFYASSTEWREVLGMKAWTDLVVDENICAYGRASNSRNCSQVHDVWTTCGVLNRMVEMDDDIMTSGDSGGPWFKGNRAVGVHHGPCGDGDQFSAVSLLPNALDAEIKIGG